MSMSAGGHAVPEINVTPLIDILLVLLIIFMVISPLKPSRFKAQVPSEPEPEQQVNVKPNPLTLVVSIGNDLKLKVNNLEEDYGSTNDTGRLASYMASLFEKRKQDKAYKPGMESRLDVPEDQRIEKTVFIKAPRSTKYGEVVKVIDALKGAGANPVGLQIDDLAP